MSCESATTSLLYKMADDGIPSPSHSLLTCNARKSHSPSEGKCSRPISQTSLNSSEVREGKHLGTKKARIDALKQPKTSHNKMNSAARSSTTRDHVKRIRVDLLKEGNSVPASGKTRLSSNKTKCSSLASNPVGALVASLSKCVVRTEEDAEVAMNVSLKLFKSFLDYRVNMNASSADKLVKAFIALISALEEHLPNVNPSRGTEGREAEEKPMKLSPKPSPTLTKADSSTSKAMEAISSHVDKESKKSSSQSNSGSNSSKSNPPPPPPPPPPPEPEDEAPPPPPPPPPPPTHPPPPESSSNPPPPPSSVYPNAFSYPPPPFTATSPTASSPVYPQNVVGTAPAAVSPVFPPGTGTFPPPPPPGTSPYQSSGYTMPAVATPAASFSRPPPPIIRHGFTGPGRPPFAMHPMPFPAQRPPMPPVPYQMPGIPYPYPRLP